LNQQLEWDYSMKIIKDFRIAFVLCISFFLLAFPFVLEGEEAAVSNDVRDSSGIDNTTINRETLVNRRFQFSWTSQQGGGVNGIATLKEDGSIEDIGSPNETTWLIDTSGRLLFKHADGRVSTRYDKVWLEEGLLCFEGPFLFREGITHHLIELEGAASEPVHKITPEQAAGIKYSTQRFVYLDIGESCTFQLKNGTEKQVSLLSVKEYEDPVIHLIRRADVKIEIEGKPIEMICAPYVMPTQAEGLRIQADTTSAWLKIPKHVQFSLWDASDPIVDANLFCFPLPGYRLFSHGMQAYNEPVHLGHRDGDPQGQRFYHNYGVDLAGYEGRQKVLNCIDGVAVQVDREQGSLSIRDDRGFILNYGHLDSILSGIKVGSPVRQGQWVGMLGRKGASGNFSHLHVGAYLSESAMNMDRSNRNLNLYPWLVAAYEKDSGTNLFAMARPHKTALTGDKVLFDGSNSIFLKSNIVSFKWEFHDGTSANGPMAEKVYDRPGCYIAALWVKDNHGVADVDFCKVKVFSRSAPEGVIPTLFVTYYPSTEVCVDEPVNFRVWPQGMEVEHIQIDFGDGTILRDYHSYSAITHKFRKPGIYVVTVTGTAGKLPVTQKVKIVVHQ
jgi:murein DD-endopeptidase MepM/ murein hydrolase activator NlpD